MFVRRFQIWINGPNFTIYTPIDPSLQKPYGLSARFVAAKKVREHIFALGIVLGAAAHIYVTLQLLENKELSGMVAVRKASGTAYLHFRLKCTSNFIACSKQNKLTAVIAEKFIPCAPALLSVPPRLCALDVCVCIHLNVRCIFVFILYHAAVAGALWKVIEYTSRAITPACSILQ